MIDPVRVVFLGSGAFAVPILDALAVDPRVHLAGVVTTPPRPAGRSGVLQPTAAARSADPLGVPVLTPERLRDGAAQAAIAELRPELMVLADYGRIVPAALLDMPLHGALNLHPSLLPRHRGATPIPAAIAAGDAQTGISLIRMDPGIDTGPLIAQRPWPLRGDEDAPGLEALLATQAARLLTDSLEGWLDGSLAAHPQPTDGATLTRPFRREDGRMDPARPAVELERLVRALQPWPGTFLERAGERIKVHAARLATPGAAVTLAPGELRLQDGALILGTSDGVLDLVTVQPAGGRPMSGPDLARGRPTILAEGRASSAGPGVPG